MLDMGIITRCTQRVGLEAVVKGLHQMGVGCCVLTETKLMDNQYPKAILGY